MAQNNQNINSSVDDGLDLYEYLFVIRKGWKAILIITAFIVVIGVLYGLIATPFYKSNVLIQVEDNSDSTQAALGDLANLFNTKQEATTEIELIKSRLVIGKTVQSMHLDISAEPRYFPLIGRMVARGNGDKDLSPAIFGLSQFGWGGERIDVSQFDVPKKMYKEEYILIAKGNGAYVLNDPKKNPIIRGQVGVSQSSNSEDGDVKILVDHLNARPGTEFIIKRFSTLNTISELQKELDIEEVTKESGVISVTFADSSSKRTADVLNAIASNYVQQSVDYKSSEAEKTLAFLDLQLPQLRKQLDDAEDKYNEFRNKNKTVDLTAESGLLLQQTVTNKEKLTDLQQQRAQLAQRFTPKHPAIMALDAQIDALQSEQSQLNEKIVLLPNTEQAALRLLRDVRVDTELYTNVLDNAQQLRIVKAGEIGNARVVDYAVVEDYPDTPKKLLIILISTVAGLIVGALVVCVRYAIHNGVQHGAEIESALGIPIYATVPHSQAQVNIYKDIQRGKSGNHILSSLAPQDVAVEGIRSLRTALQFGLLEASNNIIAIVGPRPGIGKSFTSTNLATIFAQGGKKVLIIDADFRRGDVHQYFGIQKDPGLSNILAGQNADTVIQHNVLPGVDVIPRGTVPPNPTELLLDARFASLLERASSEYDIVVVDTPPILAVTDAALIGRYAGTTLMVIRHGIHPLSEISESANRLLNNGVKLKGIVFMDVPQHSSRYGASYSYYYGYDNIP